MKNKEFAAARRIRRIVLWGTILLFFVLPFVVAAANSSLFTLHTSDQPTPPPDSTRAIKAQPVLQVEEETIPDSLLHARWKIQKTAPLLVADLDSSALDLRFPENIKQEAEYDDSLNVYRIGSKIGSSYMNTPILMSPDEYRQWSEKREREAFFRMKDAQNVQAKGKDKFDFTDMHFDLGPAEKIFGPGGVRIKTQGTAELKLGITLNEVDNP